MKNTHSKNLTFVSSSCSPDSKFKDRHYKVKDMKQEAHVEWNRYSGYNKPHLQVSTGTSLNTALKIGTVSLLFPIMTMGFFFLKDRLDQLDEINRQNGERLEQIEIRLDNARFIQDQRFKREYQYRKNNPFYEGKEAPFPERYNE